MSKKSHILKGTFFCMIMHSNFWKTKISKLKAIIYIYQDTILMKLKPTAFQVFYLNINA